MLWSLTKWNYTLSCRRLVRWWLRMTVLDRLILVVAVSIAYVIVSFFALGLWFWNWATHVIIASAVSGPLSQYLGEEAVSRGAFALGFLNFVSLVIIAFEVVLSLAVWGLSIFFVVDLFWDFVATRRELASFRARKDVILATRGEYIGGHPQLPHSRFVYLTIWGTRSDPNLSIVLPGSVLREMKEFRIPLVDLTGTTSEIDDKFGRPAFFNILLTSITPSIWKGYRSVLLVDYISAGRKYKAELGSFLRGNDEVQQWKNFLTCVQAEADSSEKPFGPWRSLPGEIAQEESY